jgi:tRNA (adenine57-N1/adenine58-N1)-methyltransferase
VNDPLSRETVSSRFESGPFRPGDRVQLTGPKGRLNTISLESGKLFHTHRGPIAHDDIIGMPDGSVVRNESGEPHLALRPLLTDFVMSMPRGAAIIYPKDAQAILGMLDVYPGATVVEAGVGSGALSLWLLRALGPQGSLFSIERRADFAEIAQANGETYFGLRPTNWSVSVGDFNDRVHDVVEKGQADRVILDMLAPWECINDVAWALTAGGVLVCYVATVTQLSRTVEALRESGFFTTAQCSETMHRTWHVEGLAVRPDHRMIGHTGFLLSARRLADGVEMPPLKRRPSKSDFTEEDVEAWTPGALGVRQVSDKSVRKRLREAERSARLSGESRDHES